jgi:hypothetical protein
MHRRTALQLLASSIISPASSSAASAQPAATPLFNGRDLAGWDTFLGKPHPSTDVAGLARNADGTYAAVVGANRDPRRVFTVVTIDGAPAIRISGEIYGALITAAEYENYHLHFQFKWGTQIWPPRPHLPRDTGCCYHSVGPHGASYGFWMRSFEFQIQEGDVGDFYSLAGVIVDVRATAVDPAQPKSDLVFAMGAPMVTGTTRRVIKATAAERPRGEWNTLDLYCLGQQSVHVVNGRTQVVLSGLRQKVGDDQVPLTRGRIQFQSEAAEVFFRDIVIRPIGKIPSHVLASGAN